MLGNSGLVDDRAIVVDHLRIATVKKMANVGDILVKQQERFQSKTRHDSVTAEKEYPFALKQEIFDCVIQYTLLRLLIC
jgi:hypothetical protein